MSRTPDLPLTPDFDRWDMDIEPSAATVEDDALQITWEDGRVSSYHPLLLAENDPAADTLHPLSRESILNPLDLPDDLRVIAADIDAGGIVRVHWSHGRRASSFHAGWLRGIAWFGETPPERAYTGWSAGDLPTPPTLDGPEALADDRVFLDWLLALREFGVARLEGLPDEDGLLMSIVERIGVVRESNFGRLYRLDIKDDPDSNAFTSDALLLHIDMPTRECPHGLQFLFCRANSASGGEGVYADAYRIAEDLREQEPGSFEALCEIDWTYNNRSRTSSYRAQGPVIELDKARNITGIRYNTWLRAPLVASLSAQDRAYRSYCAFAARAQDPAYHLEFAYRPGDLLAFDNRRILHGRKAYDAKGGRRSIEGVYADRDDLHSAIRILERKLAKRSKR